MTVLRYKGYIGSIEANTEDKYLFGQLLHMTDLVTYEAKTVGQLEKAFRHAVDDYLETCEQLNREPVKPFKGSLNVRVGTELHKQAAMQASVLNLTLNEYIKRAIQQQLRRERKR